MRRFIRSPIHYMGNKYKLLPQLFELFPKNIDTLYDLFGGSGVISLNIDSKNIVYNEKDDIIFKLFRMFKEYSANEIIERIEANVSKFDLKDVDDVGYYEFRDYINSQSEFDILDLYTVSFYSFSNLIRFNQQGKMNIPSGSGKFNSDYRYFIEECCNFFKEHDIILKNEDAFSLLENTEFKKDDFIYLDPPYTNTVAIYNKSKDSWTEEDDLKLFKILDDLNDKGIKWGLSNVFNSRGASNSHLVEWASKYNVEHLDFDYYACGKGMSNADEVYIYNYKDSKPRQVKLW